MRSSVCQAVVLVLSAAACINAQWKSFADLESDGGFRLSWTPRVDNIQFQVEARTRGYVGLGFSTDKSNADVVIGWVEDDNERAFLLDYHVLSLNSAPTLDTVQNYELLGGSQNQTHTVIRFQRPWNTCDLEQDRTLGGHTERIIWVVHKEDPNQSGLLAWHGHMWNGPKSVQLVDVFHSRSRPPSDVKHFDFVLNNFSVPANTDTLYWCKIFKVPTLKQKHHIIGYEPVLSADLVNHILMYECTAAAEQHLSHGGAVCHTSDLPQHCMNPFFAWSTDFTGEYLPDHVGIPIAESKKSTFFMLEIHYNNPSMKQVTVNSGLRLYYTDKLRQHEGATLETGVVVSPLHVIPPGQKAYKTVGYCDFHCTLSALSSSMNIVSAVLHSHRTGTEITLRHIRAGVELPPIAQDKTKHQQSGMLVEERQVLPGDEIITECVYNTSRRSVPTIGGYSTKQEMCLGFITYYPRSHLSSCLSMTPVDFFFQTFGVQKFYQYTMSEIQQILMQLAHIPFRSEKRPVVTIPLMFSKSPTEVDINTHMNEEAVSTLKKTAKVSTNSGEEYNLFDRLIIEEPEEFQNRSFASHLHKLPWSDKVFTEPIETTVYQGKHMTFCRLFNDSLQTNPQVFKFPNFTVLENSSYRTICPTKKEANVSNLSARHSLSRVVRILTPFCVLSSIITYL